MTGQHGFVALGASLDHHPVDRQPLAGPDSHDGSRGYRLHGLFDVMAVLHHDHPGAFGRQHRGQAAHCFNPADGFEISPEREQHQDHGNRIEIHGNAAAYGLLNGIPVGRQGAEADQAVRGHPAAARRAPGAREKGLAQYEKQRGG